MRFFPSSLRRLLQATARRAGASPLPRCWARFRDGRDIAPSSPIPVSGSNLVLAFGLALKKLDSRRHSQFKIARWRKASRPQLVNRRQRMFHVPRPLRRVFNLRFRASERANLLREFLDGDFFSVSHIENAGGLGLRGG